MSVDKEGAQEGGQHLHLLKAGNLQRGYKLVTTDNYYNLVPAGTRTWSFFIFAKHLLE